MIRLTESDLTRIIKRVIKESETDDVDLSNGVSVPPFYLKADDSKLVVTKFLPNKKTQKVTYQLSTKIKVPLVGYVLTDINVDSVDDEKLVVSKLKQTVEVEFDKEKVKELKELMLKSGGKQVAQKVIDIALNDEHPGQMAALKMCMDRTLPISMFEKDKAQRGAVTINITGIGATTMVEDITDIEPKDERT